MPSEGTISPAETGAPELIGIREWDTVSPIILVARPAAIPAIAQNHPKAHVVSLPEIGLYALIDDWALYLPLFQSDCTMWPVSAPDEAILAQIAPCLDLAGVRTLRWVDRDLAEPSRYRAIDVVWRNRASLR